MAAKKTAGRKRANAAPVQPTLKQKRKTKHRGEIISICAIAASILLGISIYAGGGGVAGQAVNGIFKGLFGVGAFLTPIGAAALGIFIMLNRFVRPGGRMVYLGLGVFLCVISLTHVITREPVTASQSFLEYTAAAFSGGAFSNGGLLGALVGDLLLKVLGTAGAYIAIIAVGLVLIILLTDRSIYQGVRSGIDKAKTIRPPRREREYREEEVYEPEFEKPAPAIRNPKKAIVTIDDQPKAERPRIRLFNEPAEASANTEVYVETEEIPSPIKAATIKASPIKATTIKAALAESAPIEADSIEADSIEVNEIDGIPLDAEDYEVFDREPEITTLYRRDPEPDLRILGIEDEGDSGDDDLEVYVETSKPNPLKEPEKRWQEESLPRERESVIKAAPVPRAEPVDYEFPPIDLLNVNTAAASTKGRAQILENSRKLETTLSSFGVEAKVIEVSKGPTVTRYELSPGQGVKVSRIAGLADDLALNLAAVGIRIEAPIPGKAAVGIEIPNKEVTPVFLREVIEDEQFVNFPSNLAFALGKDIAGNTVVTDIAKMPHLLIAGATGSGKSVCVNTLITSIIYKADPNDVKLLMVDPKVVELSIYNGIPHLLIPVVTDARKAAGALNWAVAEMLNRYNLFAETSVRDLRGYNALLREQGENALPQIVIIIDELADLMMAAPGEVEEAICRLAQMARAAGLHLIIATQRPSVDVITGLIKANIPSRLAFSVSSGTDSRTILDSVGAEKLLGKGDMLFYPVGMSKPKRVQGAFISDKEVESIVAFVKRNAPGEYDQEMINKITSAKNTAEALGEVDELLIYAAEFVIEKDKASASMLQRQFRIGYNKASRLIEDLEARGVVGPEDGSKPRKILMNSFQWEEYKAGL